MTQLPKGKTRLDLVREAALTAQDNPGFSVKRGRMVVNVERLVEDENNERKVFRNMDGLIDSIRAVGLVEPITVSAENDGKLRIVTGHRRFRAAKAAGLSQVEVIVRDPEDERTRRVKSIVSNVQREDIGPVEMAEALQSLLDDGQFARQDKLAEAIGKRKQWVNDILAILSLPADVLASVRASERPIAYDAISRIARLADPAQQREMIQAALAGETVRSIRTTIDQTKGKAPTAALRTEPVKPKRVFRTPHRVSVVVQAETSDLKHADLLAGLKDALEQATRLMN
jgi:ParB family transcriptional regulator, chromosome partitioning protein